jgi:putative protein-disulfide isomerase
MKPEVFYCYDAWCGWCYGFSPVMKQIADEFAEILTFEVLSGGMMISDKPKHIGVLADYIKSAYKTVEDYSGIRFGQDYLWHVNNPDKSDWFPDSEKPAVAMSIFKEYYPGKQIAFAAELQYALHFEGRDLTDDEAYRHLLGKYNIPDEDFYAKLKSSEYKEKAHYEFTLCKQLQVTGFPTVLLRASELKFYLLARGYTDPETMRTRINSVLAEIATPS